MTTASKTDEARLDLLLRLARGDLERAEQAAWPSDRAVHVRAAQRYLTTIGALVGGPGDANTALSLGRRFIKQAEEATKPEQAASAYGIAADLYAEAAVLLSEAAHENEEEDA